MSGMFLRWGLPALLTVVGGTALAIASTSETMNADLTARAAETLAAPGNDWATVIVDSRDAVLTGTATDQRMIDEATARVAATPGVRSVRSEIVLAEYISPFPFRATVRDGVVTLEGGIPDEPLRAELMEAAGATTDSLRLMSGAPDRQAWRAAVDHALAYLAHFDEGDVTLADLELSVSGRARTPEDYDALQQLAAAPPPANVELADVAIQPALASPFEWQATFDGQTITVSGFTPTADFADTLREHGIAGRPVATSLRVASGAPADFEATARTLLENLVRLEEGRAEISDSTRTLEGAPADAAAAASVQAAMAELGAAYSLAPPRVESYAFTATRTAEGIALAGYVPDTTTRDRLAAMPGVTADGLELARGAPGRFDSALDFGLGLLSHMSEGSFSIENTTLSLAGRAATVADFETLETTLALGAPQGLILSATDVKPPLASPFTWLAVKSEEGVRFSGYVPSRAARERLQTAAVTLAGDATTIADGQPANFESEAGTALGLLPLLDKATISYDGANWSMRGSVATSEAAVAADQAFARSGLRDTGWSFAVELPPAPAMPIIDPYVWQARKTADGTITFGGFLPTEELRDALLARAGDGVTDRSSLGAGQPDDFAANAAAGLDALSRLEEGTLGLDGGQWSLAGKVATAAGRLDIESRLAAAVDTSSWDILVQALDAAPVVSPYAWRATKGDDGQVTLSGYVTSAELKSFIAVRAGDNVVDTTDMGSGEPAGFIGDALAGLEALSHLANGTVALENGIWTLSGTPRTASDAELAVAALGTATAAGEGWQKQLSDPIEPVPPETPPAEEAQPPAEASPPADPAASTDAAPTVEPAEPAAPADPVPIAAPEAPTDAAPSADATTPAEPAPPTTPVVRNYTFSASKPLGGAIVLDGRVPSEGTRDFFGVIAGSVPTDNLSVGAGLPADYVPTASSGIRLLASLPSGEFGLDGDAWVLTGRVESDTERRAVLQRLATLPDAGEWQTDITLLEPIDICRQRVAAFASRNAILFQSGSARLAEESGVAIDELAAYLQLCPDTVVHVEGHTDADGADDLNLALSVARAETVVEALIDRGVAFQRLYAVGYGESLPIADNDTVAGKRANRRIAFTVLDVHE